MHSHGFEEFGELSPQDLIDFEHEIGFPLPADYRSFLLTNNGGRMDECGDVRWYFSIGNEEDGDGEEATRRTFADVIPFYGYLLGFANKAYHSELLDSATLPIADGSLGGEFEFVTIVLDGPDAGQIFLFENLMGRHIFLADSFEAFLANPTL